MQSSKITNGAISQAGGPTWACSAVAAATDDKGRSDETDMRARKRYSIAEAPKVNLHTPAKWHKFVTSVLEASEPPDTSIPLTNPDAEC